MVLVQTGMHAHAQHVQDELANLFTRNMTFNHDAAQAAMPKESARQEAPPAGPPPAAPAPPFIYSVSQHYHHSAHVAKAPAQQADGVTLSHPRRPSSEPPLSDMSYTEITLRHHGLDPAILTPSQLQLFRVADDSQKLRLMQLWSICPPNTAEDIPALAWSSTSLDQEEQNARIRYERQQNLTMSLDGTPVQTDNARWTRQSHLSESEPYMVSGYQELMRREQETQVNAQRHNLVYEPLGAEEAGSRGYSRATDPVYKGSKYMTQQQQLNMAAQYGAFEQCRGNSTEDEEMDM